MGRRFRSTEGEPGVSRGLARRKPLVRGRFSSDILLPAGLLMLLAFGEPTLAACPSAATPVPAPSPQCDNAACGCLMTIDPVCHPTGKILDAFVQRGACNTFGTPLSRVRPRLAFGGTFQTFENGEIAQYPSFASGAATPDFVLSAFSYAAPDPQNPAVLLPAIQADWGSTAPFSYDEFILRWDREDHAENVENQHNTDNDEGEDKQQLDIEGGGSSDTGRFWAPDRATYAIYVEGCDYGLLSKDCDQGWSFPVYVERLDRIVGAVPQPPTSPAQFVIPQGILDVPDYAKVPFDQQIPIVGRLCNSGTLRQENDEEDHYEELNGDTAVARLLAARLLEALQATPLNFFLVSALAAGPACAGKKSVKLRQEVSDAILASKVNSRPGTDVEGLVRIATAAALGVSIGALLLALGFFNVLGASILPGFGLVAAALGLSAAGLVGTLLLTSDPGDYDMRLVDYIRIYHHFGKDLSSGARDHMVDELLTTKGGEDERKEFLWISGLPTPAPETENHIWMTESSRYLTNNILFDRTHDSEYDNDQNGMTDWVLEGLRKFLVEDFYELNSRPYAPLAYNAIQNLSDFAGVGAVNCTQITDPAAPPQSRRCDVRRAARSVLDYLNTRFALSSDGLRRAVPFRRQPPFRDYPRLLTNGGDDMSWQVFGYTGGSNFLRDERHSHLMEWADGMIMNSFLSHYRPPLLITDLIRSPGFPSTLGVQRFRSKARGAKTAEIYYRGADFMISAGGRYDSGSGFLPDNFSEGEDAWALPTTLMPKREGEDIRDFVRIAGSTDAQERNNLCVGPGFACGMNPTLPAGLPAACKEEVGNWTFIDFKQNTPTCPFGYGYYVAFYRQSCTSDACEDAAGDPEPGSFGFFEATDWRTFDLYKTDVLQLNQQLSFDYGQFNVYRSPTGIDIAFVADTSVLPGLGVAGDSSPITGISNRVTGASLEFERDLDKWMIAQGPLVNSPREACIFIDNLTLRQRLIIDNTNATKPRRSVIPTAMAERCGCPLIDLCLSPRSE